MGLPVPDYNLSFVQKRVGDRAPGLEGSDKLHNVFFASTALKCSNNNSAPFPYM